MSTVNTDALMNHISINKYAKSNRDLFGPHSKDRAINTSRSISVILFNVEKRDRWERVTNVCIGLF
jgi:hypothetical protein